MKTAIVVLCVIATDAPSPQTTVARVQNTYRSAGDISGTFEQTYFDKLRGKRMSERGKLWATTGGMVRWTYYQPERKDFVWNGKTAYFYEPNNAQVTEFDRFADSPVANAMQFLWGQGALAETFSVAACAKQCPPADGPSELLSVLTPKEPIASVDHIVLGVDRKTYRVVRSVVYDPLGNRTEYRFSNLVFGAVIDKKTFDFRVPKGVSRVRAAVDGASSAGSQKGGK